MKYLAFCIVLLFAGTAYAANGIPTKIYECIPLVEKHKLIAKIHDMGEIFLFRGLSAKGPHLVEVYMDSETGTWTAIGTDTIKTCVLDFGRKAEKVE
jgi:hypothetical protein